MSLPDVGPLLMEDSETGEQLYVDTHDRKFRKAFATLVAERERHLGTSFQRAGVDVLSLSTGDDLVRSLMKFAMLRKQRGK
jgi:uncharacterized protein (DUF58 family)